MAVQRDAKGRLLPGSKLNPKGGSKRRKDYLSILQSTCTPAKWKKICLRAIEQAGDGDKNARKWLSEYLLGRPTQRVKIQGNVGVTLADWEARAQQRVAQVLEDLE